MKPGAKPASVSRAVPPRPSITRQLRERWREAWDSMSLAGQFRIAVIAAVTLTMLLGQLAVASYEFVASYSQSRDHVTRVATAIFQHDDEFDSDGILGRVQAQPAVIAATLQLPTGEVLWTFDRNAPDPASGVYDDNAPPLAENRVGMVRA